MKTRRRLSIAPIIKVGLQQFLIKISGIIIVSVIMFPAQADTNPAPVVMTHSKVYFTLPENSDRQVLSGTDFGASHSDGKVISFNLSGRYDSRYYFRVRNKNTVSTTGTQYAEITYVGYLFNYETTTSTTSIKVFDDEHGNGRRGYEEELRACVGRYGSVSNPRRCSYMHFRIYVTDVAEIDSMSGSISLSHGSFVGDIVIADFSNIGDKEGVNDLSIAWNKETCPSNRGLGRWTLRRRISSANDSDSYQLTSSDGGHRISVWGQYQTDAGHYKWVCNDIDDDVIQTLPEPEVVNAPPSAGTNPVEYYIDENSGSGTLSVDDDGITPEMTDVDQETIAYSISFLEGTPSNVASYIRSTFRVRNTAPNPSSRDSDQPIEISYNKSLNYETAPEIDTYTYRYESSEYYRRGYMFNVKGCDPSGECDTLHVNVFVVDISEVNTISGSIRINGRADVGQALTVDYSNVTDQEGIHLFTQVWRHGPCTSSKGTEDLPTVDSSGDSYQQLRPVSVDSEETYTLSFRDKGKIISVWGHYTTSSGLKKWVCSQTRAITGNPSVAVVSLQKLTTGSVPMGDPVEFRVTRTSQNLSSPLVVSIYIRQRWTRRISSTTTTVITRDKDMFVTIPANQNNVNFIAQGWGDNNLDLKAPDDIEFRVSLNNSSNYNANSTDPISADIGITNFAPSGKPTITGTAVVGETLTANISTITDRNNGDKNNDNTPGDILPQAFSYTWWKEVAFGSQAGVVQQISGANSSTYQIKNADIRTKIKVKVSYRDDSGYDETVESNYTSLVALTADAGPSVISVQLKEGSNEPLVPLRGRFTVPEGRSIHVVVHMSKGVGGLNWKNDARMRLQVGGQTRILDRVHYKSDGGAPSVLRFFYNVEAGDSGRITFPENGIFTANLSSGDSGTPPNNTNFSFPQTYLGNMTVVISYTMSIIATATANENTDRSLSFPVTLDRAPTETITVDWETRESTATPYTDYTPARGTLTFNPGETTKTITVEILDDNVNESSEFFQVYLSNLNPEVKVQFGGNHWSLGYIVNSDPNPPTPPPPPIKASFIGMPSEHNGSSTFTFELRFSEDLTGFSYKTLKYNGAFTVTNGSIKNARRLARPANQRWEITVQPSNNKNISISLPPTTNCSASGAICHSDGRKLSNSSTGRILGPVGISVADASANENTDSTVDFTVSLSRSSSNTITVSYATENGSATAGQDYTSKSGTLTFSAGQTSKTVSVSIEDDNVDEGNETFKLKLSNPTGGAFLKDDEAIGTIENSDPMPKAWLSRFGRTVGSQAVDAISKRMGAPSGENRVVIGGMEMSSANATETKGANLQNIHQQFESYRGNEGEQTNVNNRTMTLEELALGTSFNLSAKDENTGSTLSAWGQFANDNFKGKEGDLNLDGKVTTGFLGADVTSGNLRGGVAVSTSKGEGTFRSLGSGSAGNNGEVESRLTSVYPYVSHESGENRTVWGMFGLGEGNIKVTQKNQSVETDISMRMGAVGAKGPLMSQSAGDGMDVVLQTDGMWVRMNSEKTNGMVATESDVTRLRLMLDSSKSFEFGEGTLTPSFQMGVRHDGGDAEEGFGVETGGAVSYVAGSLTLEAAVNSLLAHEDSNYKEWGASAALRLDPGKSGRGLSLNVAPTWGKPTNNADRLWSAKGVHQFGDDNFEDTSRLEAEVGYGLLKPFASLRGLLTPYFALSLGDDQKNYRTGTRWNIAPNAIMRLEMKRTEGKTKEDEDKTITLQGGFSW